MRIQQGFSAGEMDAASPVPILQGREEIVGDPSQARPVQILIPGKIVLITVPTAKIAVIGDVPLNIKGIVHGSKKDIRLYWRIILCPVA